MGHLSQTEGLYLDKGHSVTLRLKEGPLRLADGIFGTDKSLSQASRGPVRLAGTSQACKGPFRTERLEPLKPIEGLSGLLSALTGYQGNFSGQWNWRALLGQQTTLRLKPIGII